jgi:hypothetical protein
MKGTDFEDLRELKLSVAFIDKQTRSKVKGKKLMECVCHAMAVKPDDVFAIAPAIAAYAKVTVPMSIYELPQSARTISLSSGTWRSTAGRATTFASSSQNTAGFM